MRRPAPTLRASCRKQMVRVSPLSLTWVKLSCEGEKLHAFTFCVPWRRMQEGEGASSLQGLKGEVVLAWTLLPLQTPAPPPPPPPPSLSALVRVCSPHYRL